MSRDATYASGPAHEAASLALVHHQQHPSGPSQARVRVFLATTGIVARRTAMSRLTSAAPQGLYLRAAIVIAIGLALHAAIGIVARRNATLRRNISNASRPASSTRLPRAAVVLAIGLVLQVAVGIVARRTTTSQHQHLVGLRLHHGRLERQS